MPETTVKDKPTIEAELKEVQPKTKPPHWVAIVYNPKKESKDYGSFESVDSDENRRPVPIYVRQIMLPPENGETEWIELKPGANIDVLYSQWERAANIKTVKPLIGVSIETAAYSSAEDETPGYRHFTSVEAIRLVKLTTATAWIDQWMDGEVRPEVIKAANERKAYLEKELAKRVS